MKIEGIETAGVIAEVELPRAGGKALVLKVKALPMGTEEKQQKLFPQPQPPKDYATKGGNVLRDKQGNPIVETNYDDPAWREAAMHQSKLAAILYIHEGLKADPRVKWETPESLLHGDPVKFYEGLVKEFETSGLFVLGDFMILSRRILEISNFNVARLAQAREGF